MKKLIAVLLTIAVAVSVAGCGAAPSEEKIKAALEEGTITVEDAKEKGWIDDEWIAENFEEVEAHSKIYLLDPFETTYLDGAPTSSEIIEGKMCLVFINEFLDGTLEKLEVFKSAYEEMKAAGVPVLGIVSDEIDLAKAQEWLKDMNFPVIIQNEDMRQSMELSGFDKMLGHDVVSVFTKDGGIYTAWRNSETVEGLITYSKDLVKDE